MRLRNNNMPGLGVIAAVTALMQLPAVFCGFELCDSGFYMTFYDNIFSHPEATGYNFMYYLSGLAGGAIAAMTGGSILALRMAGALCNVLCACLVWNLIRVPHRFLTLLITSLLVTAGAWGTPLTFYNDLLTILLALLSLTMLVKALSHDSREDRSTSRRTTLLLLSGAVAGINTLTRIPNVLEIFFVILIPLLARREAVRSSLTWLGGWAVGLAAGLLAAAAFGHLPLLADTIRDLLDTAATPGAESTHGLSSLVAAQISSWVTIGKTALKLLLLYAAWLLTLRAAARRTAEPAAAIRLAAGAALTAAAIWVLLRADIMTALTAAAVTGAALALRRRDLRIPAAAMLLMTFILPLGSDNGIYNAGTPILWGTLAVAVTLWFQTARGATLLCAVALLATCAANLAAAGTYFDDTPLIRMTGRIASPTASGIRTSPERAARINALTDSLRRHTSPGDTLLVYGSAPMLNHLTGTVPAIGCSWPELLSAAQLERRLDAGPAPQYIMVMRFKTLGATLGTPSGDFALGHDTPQGRFHTPAKSAVMSSYIEKKHYRAVSENADYTLYKRTRPAPALAR
ncbi:MAG: hypothetical protein K2L59_03405 [Muribaculaceae bacterium]|nr:hypothetical protein [Muribaculaceae bacterium]